MSEPASTSDDHKSRVAATFAAAAPTYGSVIGLFDHYGRLLVQLAGVQPGERVLDVAAGRGASTFPAAYAVGLTGHVVATDLSGGMVDVLAGDVRARAVENVSVEVADAENLAQFGDRSFNVVLCGFGVQFCPDPARALQEFRRVAERAAVSVPGVFNPPVIQPVLVAYKDRLRWPVGFPPKPFDVGAGLRDAGFAEVEPREEKAPFTFASFDEWWAWQYTHGARAFMDALTDEDCAALRADCHDALGVGDGPVAVETTAKFWVGKG